MLWSLFDFAQILAGKVSDVVAGSTAAVDSKYLNHFQIAAAACQLRQAEVAVTCAVDSGVT